MAYRRRLRRVQVAIRAFYEQFGKAQNSGQRCAKFVRRVAQKTLGQVLRGERLLLVLRYLLLQLRHADVGHIAGQRLSPASYRLT